MMQEMILACSNPGHQSVMLLHSISHVCSGEARAEVGGALK
jgi:hypothetical protein